MRSSFHVLEFDLDVEYLGSLGVEGGLNEEVYLLKLLFRE